MGDEPRPSAPHLVGGLEETAARLRGLPPSCGPVRLVAVDGHAGSGKTTFAGRLARELGGAPVVHLDDLATHDELFDWVDRLVTQVVEPLSRGERAVHGVYDWVARRFAGQLSVPVADVVLVEGVGAGRRALRPHLSQVLWLDVPAEVSHARGELRDGPDLHAFWRGWERAEAGHFAADPTRDHADLLVRAVPDGYEVLERRLSPR
ncbi:uridine kinase family protein [Wenjunlia tyrosinilytica]|uniref:Uridine kinase n=1 Tax=Wenjunlia tyrosinilytica TaxID=1544741 RepID=A0A917ZEZ7_9ACTN|nr:hypothetical protein [Wenjunlia tyrosinilytica]GGO82175.1 hypothetical protein GCM10012280_08140 [Wenjunlia tyrosinilytica]